MFHTCIPAIIKASQLDLSPNQAAAFSQSLDDMLFWVEKLHEVDTQGIEPLTTLSQVNPQRADDHPSPALSIADALSSAPESDGAYFLFPAQSNQKSTPWKFFLKMTYNY